MHKILCVATPDYSARWQFCIDSHRRYCEAHGYRYIQSNGRMFGVNPKWVKIKLAIRALKRADNVMILDADAQFSPDCPPFHELLAQNPTFDILYANGKSGRLNSGVLMLRGGRDAVASAYLKECMSRRETPVSAANFVTAEGENGHLIEVLESTPFLERSLVISRDWNCTDPAGFASANIRHFTGPMRRALRDRAFGDAVPVLPEPAAPSPRSLRVARLKAIVQKIIGR